MTEEQNGIPAGSLVVADRPPNPDLARWVRGVFTSMQIERLELHHGGAGGASMIKSWSSDEITKGGGPDELIRDVYQAAIADTDGAGFTGSQRYVMLCYPKDSQGRPARPSRHIFRIEARGGWDTDNMPLGDFESEPPGKAIGLVAQAQRHAEGAMRLGLMGAHQAMQQISRQLDRMSAREDMVATRELRLLELHENLLNRQVERDQDREDKQMKRDMLKQLGNVGAAMLPHLLPSILAKVMPGGSVEPAIMNLVSSLDESQVGAIMASLNDQQRAQFFELFNMLRQKQEAMNKAQAEAQAAAEAAQGGKPPPEQ
jgi:hypothetical protein